MAKNGQLGAKVGLLSRIDYGSRGFRKAVLDRAFDCLKTEGTPFNVVSGLIHQKEIIRQIKEYVKSKMEGQRLSAQERKEMKHNLEKEFLESVAKNLASIIPTMTVPDPDDPSKQKTVDLFIVTSPAFEGEIGERVAHSLSELRPDIRVYNPGGDRILVKYVDKLIWVLSPAKAVWMRGDYYSTAVERVIKDKIKQTSQSSPYLYVVMCFGSSIHKPKGELRYQYVSVPNCSRIEETRVSENQIGVSVLEFPADGSEHLFRTYNLKDLVSQELSFVVPPEDASGLQKKMIEVIKKRGWATPGILKYELDVSNEEAVKGMDDLMKKKTFRRKGENWPGITWHESGKKYYFDLDYVQNRLKYAPIEGPWNEDVIVSFSCLHSGSIETDYTFFINEVPRRILMNKAKIFVNAGDTIEGMAHNLDRKGEVVAGMNNHTVQEKFAANLIGTVIFKVFEERFRELLKDVKKDDLTVEKLKALVDESLVLFIYRYGNHDLWMTNEAHIPLEVFRSVLVRFLVDHIEKLLAEDKLPYISLTDLVEEKIQLKEIFNLPSGLKVSVQHPHMARAKTTSLRPQGMMEYAKRHGCQVAIGGNFHVSENIEEWDMDLGQCVCQQVGTIKHGSNFERNKMKMVDQGIGFLRILSKNGKIFMTESAFYGEPTLKSPIDNLSIVNPFVEKFGVDPIK